MKFIETNIPDVLILEPAVFGDERGFFMETFRADDFAQRTGAKPFVQDNHSKSAQGILRGLHYQLEQPQGKLVRVVFGAVFDVAVDMRKDSPTFGQWVGVELSAHNKRQLWVPEGFAHGFYVMSESAEFVYKCTDYYAPSSEVSVKWDDPELGVEWPLVDGKTPLLSGKDENGVSFSEAPGF
ncbi:dTDP-4-dehydrorhamnose 3,5-epimerase [Echinimonas agarilytica]|uniref:dTDP-4-dehydrorhamnose 3,5-epimerase n=1 Tax=Echinimonas agarilytica TaxID=1215918 RepID=A0AA41W8A5_9GAMM|nr:dTDP-4-dehydrorhamnose 3,5-epimerase [Echinimonas agarilytica]MCM2680114.1 dTDP-4-dehydrorhamnose 3,5-epimerase [Echinimonas agarilytica]